jgi:hypothetical protein
LQVSLAACSDKFGFWDRIWEMQLFSCALLLMESWLDGVVLLYEPCELDDGLGGVELAG